MALRIWLGFWVVWVSLMSCVVCRVLVEMWKGDVQTTVERVIAYEGILSELIGSTYCTYTLCAREYSLDDYTRMSHFRDAAERCQE